MEYLEQLTGVKITAYSYYAAAGMFVFGVVELIFMKIFFFSKFNTAGANDTSAPAVVKRGITVESMNQFVWVFLVISTLVILPAIAFVFFGKVIESIFSNLEIPLINKAYG